MPNLSIASISFTASGDNTVVAGVSEKIIQVFKLVITAAGTTNLVFKDGTAGTALTGPIPFVANEQLLLAFDTTPHFAASPGNNFVVNSSISVQVSGAVWFIQR
jgi:hypothetical protein